MTPHQWDDIQRTIEGMSQREKAELLNCVIHALNKPTNTASKQQDALKRLRAELATLPVHNPSDGFSGRDHDKVLYGGSKYPAPFILCARYSPF